MLCSKPTQQNWPQINHQRKYLHNSKHIDCLADTCVSSSWLVRIGKRLPSRNGVTGLRGPDGSGLPLYFWDSLTNLKGTPKADGFLARRYKMQSVLGTILDPAADKTLMTTLTITLAIRGLLPGVSLVRWFVMCNSSNQFLWLSWSLGGMHCWVCQLFTFAIRRCPNRSVFFSLLEHFHQYNTPCSCRKHSPVTGTFRFPQPKSDQPKSARLLLIRPSRVVTDFPLYRSILLYNLY